MIPGVLAKYGPEEETPPHTISKLRSHEAYASVEDKVEGDEGLKNFMNQL